MEIAVCDDEKIILDICFRQIKDLLAMQDNNCQIDIDCYTSGEELIGAFAQGKKYDIVILDIKLQTLNGFEVARIIREYNDDTLLIFITSSKEFVYRSFEYQPFWFLIKPISNKRLIYVLTKAIEYLMGSKMKTYPIYTRDTGVINLEINKILYLESYLRKIILYTNTQEFSYYATLKEEEAKLKKHNFIRTHKAFLINMSYIERFNKTNIMLKNNMLIPVSERRKKEVFESFTNYLVGC